MMPVTKQRRLERRKKAEAMAVEYAKLSIKEKLARIPEGGGKKQRKRLEALLKAEA